MCGPEVKVKEEEKEGLMMGSSTDDRARQQ